MSTKTAPPPAPPPEPNKQLAPVKPSALMLMASRLNVEPEKMLKALKDTVFKNANDSELLALVVISNEYGLNPLLKEIYAFPAKGGGIQPVVSIDGWIKIINRQPKLDGVKFAMEFGDDDVPVSCTSTIFVKGRKHPVEVTEYFAECFRQTDPWKQMPRRMLRHKSLIQGGRVAFGFSGIQDEDEARDSLMKQANAHEVPRASLPNFSNESAPENKTQEGGEKTDASSGSQVAADSEGAPGDGETNPTGQPASAAPGENKDDLGWPKEATL